MVIFGFFITYRRWDIINLPEADNPLYLSRTSPHSAGKQPVARQGWVEGALKPERDNWERDAREAGCSGAGAWTLAVQDGKLGQIKQQ